MESTENIKCPFGHTVFSDATLLHKNYYFGLFFSLASIFFFNRFQSQEGKKGVLFIDSLKAS